MQRLRLNTSIAIIILIGLCHTVLGAPSLRIKRSDVSDVSSISDANDLNPIVSEDSAIEDADRDKRTIVDKHSGKNAILGYVFSGSKNAALGSLPQAPTNRPVVTTTDDTPDFDRNRVSLDVPDKLFGSSFSTVTNVSKIFGDLIMSTARRYSQFIQFFKPLLGKHLTVKGYKFVPTTTAKPIDFDSDDI